MFQVTNNMKNFKMTVVVPVLNQFEIALQTLDYLIQNLENPHDVEFLVLDNGSKELFLPAFAKEFENKRFGNRGVEVRIIRYEQNGGAYPFIFAEGVKHAKSPIIAFFHSDLFVYQKGWDTNVIAHFEGNSNLGLLGFIGSTQMDNHGGRGLGTHSNMQGKVTARPSGGEWRGSYAHIHGKQDAGFVIDGAVVDGCVMIFRKECLEKVGFKDNYPIHHFYDRMLSLQTLEAGYKVGILGIEFDHISGQTVNQEQTYQDSAKAWFKEKLGLDTPEQWAELRKDWVYGGDRNNPSHGKVPNQYDHATYLEAEFLFLTEYRDSKKIIPVNC